MRLAQYPTFLFALMLLLVSACQTTPPPEPPKPAAAPAPAPAVAPTPPPPEPITPETARNLANSCFTCHGPEGRSPGTIPSISNLSAEEIAAKLRAFKSGAEPSTAMGRLAKGYTDAEMDALASYIAGLKK
jgi:sulfide dehydrogenase cytochrome subunit